MSMIKNWSDNLTESFQKSAMTFKHGLHETGLFTDEAMIDLLNRHPAEEMDVCSASLDGETHFRTGDFRDADGETLLKIAKTGDIWINLRRAMNIHPEYKSVLDSMYGDLADKTGVKAVNPRGGILISSPKAKVPYHFDKTETILWHVRGQKSLYLYPMTTEYLSDEACEAAIINRISEDAPYDAAFEKGVQIFDLEDNQAITWPLNSPHRVVNSTFCVSVTTEYSTAESARKNANMVLNATLRRKFGRDPCYQNDGELKRMVKSVFGRVLKKSGIAAKIECKDYVTFKVVSGDISIHDVEPYLRDF